jgi:hypothetical protein
VRTLTAACAALVLAATPAHATFFSFEELAHKCGGDQMDQAMCYGYVAGAVDGMEVQWHGSGFGKKEQCVPVNVRLDQIVKNAARYVADHAGEADRDEWGSWSASVVIAIATIKTWCP